MCLNFSGTRSATDPSRSTSDSSADSSCSLILDRMVESPKQLSGAALTSFTFFFYSNSGIESSGTYLTTMNGILHTSFFPSG